MKWLTLEKPFGIFEPETILKSSLETYQLTTIVESVDGFYLWFITIIIPSMAIPKLQRIPSGHLTDCH